MTNKFTCVRVYESGKQLESPVIFSGPKMTLKEVNERYGKPPSAQDYLDYGLVDVDRMVEKYFKN